ncbi:MAG: CHASE3 domain-containing protein, partial [Rhodospirillales bacterium]|nr:CHASE3 domain-containing protein [Rhodospirillales bacterium]
MPAGLNDASSSIRSSAPRRLGAARVAAALAPSPRRDRLWWWLAPIIAASVALLGVNLISEFALAPALRASQAGAERTLETIATALRFDETVQETERSQRGYVITGDPTYLELYEQASQEAPLALDRLRQLATDGAAQQARLAQLADLLDRRLASLRKTATIRQLDGFDAARQAIETMGGRTDMRAISGVVADILASEDRLLRDQQRQVAAVQRENAWESTAVAVLTAGILLLGGIPFLLTRLRSTEATLHESEERLRLLVGSIRDYAIFMLDAEGRIATWNEGAQLITGYAASEIVGWHISVLYPAEDIAADTPARDLHHAMTDGRIEVEGWRTRKDGTQLWAGTVMSAIDGRNSGSLGVAVVLHDLTERRERQATLERRRAALVQAQKMEALGQLTGGIVHDFNNMLMAIMSSVEVLQARMGDPGFTGSPRLLATVQRAAERGAGLTRQLLAFSRRQALQPRRVAVDDLVRGMSDLLARTLGQSVAIETRAEAGRHEVLVDPNQLENALLNLAINARDAMPAGGRLQIVTGTAEISAAPGASPTEAEPGQYVTIAISDTGTGMAAGTLARAFEPFFTTKPTDRGTG